MYPNNKVQVERNNNTPKHHTPNIQKKLSRTPSGTFFLSLFSRGVGGGHPISEMATGKNGQIATFSNSLRLYPSTPLLFLSFCFG